MGEPIPVQTIWLRYSFFNFCQNFFSKFNATICLFAVCLESPAWTLLFVLSSWWLVVLLAGQNLNSPSGSCMQEPLLSKAFHQTSDTSESPESQWPVAPADLCVPNWPICVGQETCFKLKRCRKVVVSAASGFLCFSPNLFNFSDVLPPPPTQLLYAAATLQFSKYNFHNINSKIGHLLLLVFVDSMSSQIARQIV